jgi:hypothetical protein
MNNIEPAIPGYIALALFIGKELYTLLNHHRIRSVCCNRMCISSVDIEETTPPPPAERVSGDTSGVPKLANVPV